METSNKKASFEAHPLYREAQELMDSGDGAGAAKKLEKLATIFPQEQILQDMLVRSKLQASLATSGPVPALRSEPTPVLRRLVLALLAITMCLVAIAAFGAAYDRLVLPARESRQQELYIESLQQSGQARIEAGDWAGARAAYEELLAAQPADPTAVAALELIDQQEILDQQYSDATAALQRGDVETALSLFRQLNTSNPGYRDVQQRIAALEQEESLEANWQQSESLIQAGDWAGAIAVLTQIRAQNPDFRRTQVEAQLFQLYAQLARELIARADSSVETLRQAVGYLDAALALEPTNQDMLVERRLAAGYVAGADAWAREDWAGAAAQWESVYAERPDYQGGVLRDKLLQAYPRAAEQLIAQAEGRLNTLQQAAHYLDQAIAAQPNNEQLVEERRLLLEFIAGAEAFTQRDWDVAISHWGPIFASHPSYQNGVLEARLRQACASSRDPDTTLCPP